MKRYYIEGTRPEDSALRRAGLCLLLATLGKTLIWPLFSALFSQLPAEGISLLSELIYKIALVAAPTLLFFRSKPFQTLRLRPISAAQAALTAAQAAVCVLFSGALSTLWAQLLAALGGEITQSIAPPASAGDAVSQLILYALLPGLCEELLFRGALLHAWAPYGRRYSVLLSAVLFMLFHESLQGAPVQLLMGVLLGEVVLVCDSLYAGMLFHALFNALTLAVSWMSQSNYAFNNAFIQSPAGQIILLIAGLGAIGMLIKGLHKTGQRPACPQRHDAPDGSACLLLAVCALKMLMLGIEDTLRLFGL